MKKGLDDQAKQQIRNLLLVIFSGVGLALLVTLLMIFRWGPTGQYLTQDVLVSPDLMTNLAYNDSNPKTGGSSRFVFDRLEYEYYDLEKQLWQKVVVSQDQYAQFFKLVTGERSLLDIKPSLVYEFNQATPARLTLWVRTESVSSLATKKIFQEVHFSKEGNYFRVQLRQTTSGPTWVYFKRDNIYQEVLQIFTTV